MRKKTAFRRIKVPAFRTLAPGSSSGQYTNQNWVVYNFIIVFIPFQSFDHPAFKDRDLLFILDKVPNLKHFMHVIKDKEKEDMVLDTLKRFEEQVVPIMYKLEKGMNHCFLYTAKGNILAVTL